MAEMESSTGPHGDEDHKRLEPPRQPTHAEVAAALLEMVAAQGDGMSEVEVNQRLSVANTHALLACAEVQRQSVVTVEAYRVDLAAAIALERERLEREKLRDIAVTHGGALDVRAL